MIELALWGTIADMPAPSQTTPFPLRMAPELRERLEAHAKKNGRSVNSEIVAIVTSALASQPDASTMQDGALLANETPRQGALQIATDELLKKLLERLGAPHMQLPVQIDAWDIECIARYMKRSANTIRREVVVQPSFPKAMRLPGAARGQALYKAREVVAWLESQTS